LRLLIWIFNMIKIFLGKNQAEKLIQLFLWARGIDGYPRGKFILIDEVHVNLWGRVSFIFIQTMRLLSSTFELEREQMRWNYWIWITLFDWLCQSFRWIMQNSERFYNEGPIWNGMNWSSNRQKWNLLNWIKQEKKPFKEG